MPQGNSSKRKQATSACQPKHWYMEWVVKDWLADPAVSLLKDATRGIWFDAICHMFVRDRCGELVGTISDLATLCRTTSNGIRAAIDDLKLRNAADVDERDGIVTLRNRRMRREWTARKSARERKKRERKQPCHTDVTRDVTSNSPFKDEVEVKSSGVQVTHDSKPGRERAREDRVGPVSGAPKIPPPIGSWGPDDQLGRDVRTLMRELRLGEEFGPLQFKKFRELVQSGGVALAKRELNEALAKGIVGYSAVTYAAASLGSELAKQRIAAEPIKGVEPPTVYPTDDEIKAAIGGDA